MVINKKFFDECWCPCEGIGRVCLNGSKGIPEGLEDIGKRIDGDEYTPSAFSIDIIVENGQPHGGMINYMSEVEGFIDCFVCSNYKEAWEYYKDKADKDSYAETMGK